MTRTAIIFSEWKYRLVNLCLFCQSVQFVFWQVLLACFSDGRALWSTLTCLGPSHLRVADCGDGLRGPEDRKVSESHSSHQLPAAPWFCSCLCGLAPRGGLPLHSSAETQWFKASSAYVPAWERGRAGTGSPKVFEWCWAPWTQGEQRSISWSCPGDLGCSWTHDLVEKVAIQLQSHPGNSREQADEVWSCQQVILRFAWDLWPREAPRELQTPALGSCQTWFPCKDSCPPGSQHLLQSADLGAPSKFSSPQPLPSKILQSEMELKWWPEMDTPGLSRVKQCLLPTGLSTWGKYPMDRSSFFKYEEHKSVMKTQLTPWFKMNKTEQMLASKPKFLMLFENSLSWDTSQIQSP